MPTIPKVIPTTIDIFDRMSVLHHVTTVVLVLLAIGLMLRRDSKWHPRFMLTAFCLDFFVFIYLEITSYIVETAITVPRPILLFHATCAFAMLVCYFLLIYLGGRILKGDYTLLVSHKTIACVFIPLRIAAYVTSYFIWF